MLTLDKIEKKVQVLVDRKSDVILKLLALTPSIKDGNVQLKSQRGTTHGLIHNGLPSYLNRIEIPTGFFKKCSDNNKRGLLEQFHTANVKQEVLVRKLDKDIRFIASSKYCCFDDKDVIKSLKDTNMQLSIKEFHQGAGTTILRAINPDPITVSGGRPFYPGLQIVNSEVGNSSVKVQFFLWEEICTNGVVVARGNFPMFSMRHIGKKDHSQLSKAVNEKISSLPKFTDMCAKALKELNVITGKEMIQRIEKNIDIPKVVKTSLPEKLRNYADNLEESTALDVISAMTETIQHFPWERRIELEQIAGDYLLNVA